MHVVTSRARRRKAPRLFERSGEEERPAIGAQEIEAMLISGLEDIDIARVVLAHDDLVISGAPVLEYGIL